MSRKKMSTRKAFMKKECVSKSPNNYAEIFLRIFWAWKWTRKGTTEDPQGDDEEDDDDGGSR